MEVYQSLVEHVLRTGTHKPNRTGVDTISTFNYNYEIDLRKGYPLLTTKKMDTFRWNSMLHELFWYFSGEHHIRKLSEETGIWDAWADDSLALPTAYGRFWRRYPVPEQTAHLDGEAWADDDMPWVTDEREYFLNFDSKPSEDVALRRTEDLLPDNEKWTFSELRQLDTIEETTVRFTAPEGFDKRHSIQADDVSLQSAVYGTGRVVDQLEYVVKTLKGENPNRSPHSRRLVVNAWHPANAIVSTLPPCHYTFAFNVQDDTLHLHLTQRSADIALGVPFNIACYAAILKLVAKETGFKMGKFAHSLVDAHAYCGEGERGEWYAENLDALQSDLYRATGADDYEAVLNQIEEKAPADPDTKDHVPNLLRQLMRTPYERPTLEIADKPMNSLTTDDFTLTDYESHDPLSFGVAE